MRAVLQRVSRAQVRVDGAVVGRVGRGLCVLLCAMDGDTDSDAQFMARKIPSLRIFPDADGRMNLDLSALSGELLLISQFTLAADTTSGTRPSFSKAAVPTEGQRLVDLTAELLKAQGIEVQAGIFGAKMEVELVDDGPITILLDSRDKR